MQKLISILVAAMFAAVTFNAVAADKPQERDGQFKKKSAMKGKKAEKKGAKKDAQKEG